MFLGSLDTKSLMLKKMTEPAIEKNLGGNGRLEAEAKSVIK